MCIDVYLSPAMPTKFIFSFFMFFSLIANSQIISYELIESWTTNEVSQLYSDYSIPPTVGNVTYSVDGYKLNYLTEDFDGEKVLCSGSIYFPRNIDCEPPILSWQHGTMVNNFFAPSNIGNTDNDLIGAIGASNGYIVTMSDFIGLGDGEGIHNYIHAKTQATSTIDLILIAKEISNEIIGVESNDQLFLFGYSQGGHATMATVKEIETFFSDQLQITASAPMAGPYDMSGAQRIMLETGNYYPNPGYLPYIILSYNKIYNLYDNLNEIFKAPFTNIEEMYNGNYSMWQINNYIWEIAQENFGISPYEFSPINIFNEDYYQNYLEDENHPFRVALADNNVFDFIPTSPMRMLHCSGDDNVSFENAQNAYNYFVENNTLNIELIDGGDYNHEQCATIAIIGAKMWIDSYADLCEINVNLERYSNKEVKKRTIDVLGRSISNNRTNFNFQIDVHEDGRYNKRITFY